MGRYAKLGGAILVVGSLVMYFNNCSQPYQLNTVQNSAFLSSQSTDVVLISPTVTNDKNLRFKLSKEYAQEVYVTTDSECSAGGEWVPYSEELVYALPDSDGAYVVGVKFRNFGKVETPCASTSVTLDATPPAINIPLMPATFTNQARVSLQVTATDNLSGIAEVACDLNGTVVNPCDAINTRNLTQGAYTFTVNAKDSAGNSAAPLIARWTVDMSAPSVNITSMPATFTQQRSATFAFTAADAGSAVAGTTCALDNGAAAACTSPVTYNNLADGSHRLVIAVTDQAGNSSSRTANWTVDTVAPTLVFVSVPPALTNSPNVSLTFTAMDGGSGLNTVQCALDGGTPAACSSPRNYSNLADGPHSVRVTATDRAGNTTTITSNFSIDAAEPMVTLTATPAANTRQTTATFNISVVETATSVASQTCMLDANAAASCGSTVTYNGLAEGAHSFKVTVTDAAGNVATVTYNWVIDRTNPSLSFTSAPGAMLNSRTANFAFTATDAGSGLASLQCSADGGAFATCTSPRSLTNLTDGPHSFSVTATDKAGNTTSVTSSFSVDAMGPAITLTSKPDPNTWLTSGSVSFSYSITDANSVSATCKLDNGAASSCGTTGTSYNGIADGSHSFTLTATDAAGNSATATANFKVDRTAPNAPTFTQTPSRSGNRMTFRFSATDATSGIAGYRCAVSGIAAESDCTSPIQYSGLSSGDYTVTVFAVDNAGNRSANLSYSFTMP